jgi:hypothetical protein
MKLIRFFTEKQKEKLGTPKPTKQTIPQWYKHAESTFTEKDGSETAGLKKCMPYVDAMMSGYVLTVPVDIHVTKNKKGGIELAYDETVLGQFIHERPAALGRTMPRPPGFAPNHLAYKSHWGWSVPKGFSVLVTHPFNRVELPFHTVTALMDSDEFFASGNIPFFIREDFEGVIEAGTPIAQLLPVKREDWKMIENDQSLFGKASYHSKVARDPRFGYKKVMWHRKEYN